MTLHAHTADMVILKPETVGLVGVLLLSNPCHPGRSHRCDPVRTTEGSPPSGCCLPVTLTGNTYGRRNVRKGAFKSYSEIPPPFIVKRGGFSTLQNRYSSVSWHHPPPPRAKFRTTWALFICPVRVTISHAKRSVKNASCW